MCENLEALALDKLKLGYLDYFCFYDILKQLYGENVKKIPFV